MAPVVTRSMSEGEQSNTITTPGGDTPALQQESEIDMDDNSTEATPTPAQEETMENAKATPSEDIIAFARAASSDEILGKITHLMTNLAEQTEVEKRLQEAGRRMQEAKVDTSLIPPKMKSIIEKKVLMAETSFGVAPSDGQREELVNQFAHEILENSRIAILVDVEEIKKARHILAANLRHLELALTSREMGVPAMKQDQPTPRSRDTIAKRDEEAAKNRREITKIHLDHNTFTFPGEPGENALLQADVMIAAIRNKADLMFQAAGGKRDDHEYRRYWTITMDLDSSREDVREYWSRMHARTDDKAEYIILIDSIILDCIRKVLMKDIEDKKPSTYAKEALIAHLEAAMMRSDRPFQTPNSAAETLHVFIKTYKINRGQEVMALMRKWNQEPAIQSRRDFKEAILKAQAVFPLVYGTGKGPNVEGLFTKVTRYWGKLNDAISREKRATAIADDHAMSEALNLFFRARTTINMSLSERKDEQERLATATKALADLTVVAQSLHAYNVATKPANRVERAEARGPTKVAAVATERTSEQKHKGVCWECGEKGHFKGDPKCQAGQVAPKTQKSRGSTHNSSTPKNVDAISLEIDKLIKKRRQLRNSGKGAGGKSSQKAGFSDDASFQG